jgi:hypothetical protein
MQHCVMRYPGSSSRSEPEGEVAQPERLQRTTAPLDGRRVQAIRQRLSQPAPRCGTAVAELGRSARLMPPPPWNRQSVMIFCPCGKHLRTDLRKHFESTGLISANPLPDPSFGFEQIENQQTNHHT